MPDDAKPLLLQPAHSQYSALASRSISPVELCRMHLEAAELANPSLNCYTHLDAKGALEAAEESQSRHRDKKPLSPLDGLCLAVKDNIAVAGMPLTAGMACRRNEIAKEDAPVVKKLRDAGMVILGKLNMDEAALGTGGRNPHFGHCHNPWRNGYSPGGSSSGSGSACAAGLASVALGTDTMGSVRLPAAMCGLYGLKPGKGRLSLKGVVPVAEELDTIGILAREAKDLQLVWDLLDDAGGPGLHDVKQASSAFGCLAPVAGTADEDIWTAVSDAAERAEALGKHRMAVPGFCSKDASAGRRAGLVLSELGLLQAHSGHWKSRGPGDFSDFLAGMMAYAEKLEAGSREKICRQLPELEVSRWLSEALTACDTVLMPTAPCVSFGADQQVPDSMADFTAPASLCGLPAVSLPVGINGEGLPLAVQLVGRSGEESSLIRLAAQLGAVTALRRPVLWLEQP